MVSPLLPRARRSGALIFALGLLAAPAAHADSISFLRGGDIWVAAADGSQQTQLTHDGGYSYHSRADDGSMIALKGRQLQRLTAEGAVVATFDTPASDPSTEPPYIRGPYKPEISPDASKVAYEYLAKAAPEPGCTGVLCGRISEGIAYTYPDRMTSWDEPSLGRQSGWLDPSWIDNGTLLLSNKSVYPNADAMIDHPGDGNQTIQEWFEDAGAWYLKDAELSRRGDALVFVSTVPRGSDDPRLYQEDDQVTVYRTNGPIPAAPEGCWSFRDDDRVMESPSIAPDGHAVAFASKPRVSTDPVPARIEVGAIPDQRGGCAKPDAGSTDLILDATNPDWSPAPTPVVRQSGGGGGGTQQNGGGGGTQQNNGGTQDAGGKTVVTRGPRGETTIARQGVTLAFPKRSVKTARARGLRPKVTLPGAGRLDLRLDYKGKRVAKGTVKAKAAGSRSVALRLSATGRKALKKAKKPTLVLRFTFTPATGAKVAGQAKLRLG